NRLPPPQRPGGQNQICALRPRLMNPVGLYSGMSPPGRVGFIAGNIKFKVSVELPEYPAHRKISPASWPRHTDAKSGYLKEILGRPGQQDRGIVSARPAARALDQRRTTSTEHAA